MEKDVLLNHTEFATSVDLGSLVPEGTLLGELVVSVRKANEARGNLAAVRVIVPPKHFRQVIQMVRSRGEMRPAVRWADGRERWGVRNL